MKGRCAHIALGCAGLAALGGCGAKARQDADEPAARYEFSVVEATFPAKQRLAKPSELRIAVKNTGRRAAPNVAVTVSSFSRRSQQAGLADPSRPVWIVDAGPRGGTTAYVDTWAIAGLPPGRTQTFRWRVTAVVPGRHQLKWTVAAGLDGKAKARPASAKSPLSGTFVVTVSPRASSARVDPAMGAVIRDGEAPPR